ncbi:hypothetical protein ACJX0J_015203, partial [Zea mays]
SHVYTMQELTFMILVQLTDTTTALTRTPTPHDIYSRLLIIIQTWTHMIYCTTYMFSFIIFK